MNQILITGDEQRTGKVIENVKKQKKVLPVNGVVVFFATILII